LPVTALLAAAAFLAFANAARAQTVLQPPRGFGTTTADVVVDAARVLDAASIARINALSWTVHAGSRGEVVVVTLPDLGGQAVGDVALAIGRAWGVGANAPIGDRARNAGVVVLLVPRETSGDGSGHIAIQVGQGAEGFIPDAVAGDIRREATPLLQRGEYGPALALITARLAERYSAEFGFPLDGSLVPPRRTPAPEPGGGGGFPPILLVIAFFVLVSFLNGMGRRRRRFLGGFIPIPFGGRRHGGWGGGFGGGFGGGGGFSGFGGGGGFSGGGSSGRF
jgi:uncharacterized protein